MSILSLKDICLQRLMRILEEGELHVQMINELCKYLQGCPHLLEPVLQFLLMRKAVTDVALLAFLVPDRIHLDIRGVSSIRNSTLKMIGGNCPNMVSLNLSDCVQVSNAVIRNILMGCSSLREICLDRCLRVTDAAFDPNMSPFDPLRGCYSLENISLQGCNQVTGKLTSMLMKHYRKLKNLNLSQCKQIAAPSIQEIFIHSRLRSINLSFTSVISDEAFLLLPPLNNTQMDTNSIVSESSANIICMQGSGSVFCPVQSQRGLAPVMLSSLEQIELGMCKITDQSLFRLAQCGLSLKEISLEWCDRITDEGVRVLVKYCLHLQDMNLKSCRGITNESLQAIGQKCSGLKKLNISWCQDITDEGVKQLSPSCSGICTMLESLCIVWCPLISDVSLCELAASLPQLTYVEAVGCSNVTDDCVAYLISQGIKVSS